MHGHYQYSLLLFLLAFTLADSAAAQRSSTRRRFKEGDRIQYHWVNKWLPGVVLQVEDKRVAIEYEWGSGMKQQIVSANELRFAWEERAFTPMRSWTDQSKKFRIRAAAVGLEEGNVVLHKDDESELTVPIDKLSDTDQRYLKKYIDQMGPPVAKLPPLSNFRRNSSGRDWRWSEAKDLSAVSPDATPSYADLPMQGIVFPRAHFFENLIRVHPIGGSDGWVCAGTVDSHGEKPSRIMWLALTSQSVRKLQLVPNGERLSAVDPGSKQFLTVNKEGPRLTLWSADPTKDVPQAKKSWISLAPDNWGSWNNWAEIVSPTRVMHEWGRSQFVVWDTATEREVYRIEQESFFNARPTLSPGKKYIALPEDKRVRIVEAATGKTLASLDIEGGSAAGVGFSQDGSLLAILTRSQLAIWTLGSSETPQRYRADSIGTPFKARVEFVNNHSLLIDREILFDTRHELPVWSYQAKTFEVKNDTYGEKTQTIIADKLCYAVTIRQPQDAFVVGAVELPGPGVEEALANFDRESLYVLRPGDRFSIKVDCGQHNTQVERDLRKQIEDNGWVFDPSSSTVLSASMGRSETQTVTYRNQMSGESQTVTTTPHFSRMEIIYNGTSIWSTSGGSGLPPVMFVDGSESIQQKASASERPDAGLFSRAEIPEKIFDPAKKRGLGSSLISSRGLTVQ